MTYLENIAKIEPIFDFNLFVNLILHQGFLEGIRNALA
jgi:hypothetical protein